MAAIEARRKRSEKPRSGVQLNIRTDASVKERVEHAAQVARQSLTEFTRDALMDRADEVLRRHESIILSNRDYEQFVAIMTADTEPTEIAKREASEYRRFRADGTSPKW
jgi:uncharacterized protein (DUF1778 family)